MGCPPNNNQRSADASAVRGPECIIPTSVIGAKVKTIIENRHVPQAGGLASRPDVGRQGRAGGGPVRRPKFPPSAAIPGMGTAVGSVLVFQTFETSSDRIGLVLAALSNKLLTNSRFLSKR